jgi:hypothetical protein
MLLEIEEDVFTEQVKDVMAVLKLVEFTVEQRHSWLPTPPVAETACRFLEVKAAGLASWSEYVLNAATASVWQGADQISPTTPTSPVTVTASNVADLAMELGQPAVIVVENERNDGGVLRAVFAAYEPKIHAALQKRWLEIGHGGGADQPHVAAAAAKRFKHVCRVMVVKDNDDRIPLQAMAAEDLAAWPSTEPLEHVWWRHEIENYLPDAALERSPHPQAADLLRHLRALSTREQGLIDMKDGLKSGPASIGSSLPPDGRRLWRNGYGKLLPKPLVSDDLRLTVDDFRALGEDVHRELLHLLDKIKRVL